MFALGWSPSNDRVFFMEEVFNRYCSECLHEVDANYDSNNCPNCGAESIPTIDSSVIRKWPDNSSIELFWDGKKSMSIRTGSHPGYEQFGKLEFPEK